DRCPGAGRMRRHRRSARQRHARYRCPRRSPPRACRRGEENASSFSEKTSRTNSLLRLFLTSALECRKRIPNVAVVGLQFQGSVQFLLGGIDVARAAVEQPKILVKVGTLRATSAELDGLIHLL